MPSGFPENPGKDTRWKPGQSGNPAGKPKGAGKKLKFLMADILHDADFDWAEDFSQALKNKDEEKIGIYEKFAPYLFAVVRVKEIEIKPEIPSDSLANANKLMDELKKAANETVGSNTGTLSADVGKRVPVAEVQADPTQVQ